MVHRSKFVGLENLSQAEANSVQQRPQSSTQIGTVHCEKHGDRTKRSSAIISYTDPNRASFRVMTQETPTPTLGASDVAQFGPRTAEPTASGMT
jgi:hypothetical protein